MRQAGRSLPEYRETRAGVDMLESCLRPELAAEITLQPVNRYQVDAAIFFSDIMVPLKLAGVPVEIRSGVGPVFDRPYATAKEISVLTSAEFGDSTMIAEAVSLVVDQLGGTPLLGFAGAPFTLAAYLAEGAPSRDHLAARRLMHTDPGAWRALMTWCATLSRKFLEVQIGAGASAVQVFDSWVGSLSKEDYVNNVLPYTRQIFDGLPVPAIHFGMNTGLFLPEFNSVGAAAIGIDYRVPLDRAVDILGGEVVVQGNIDPALLAAPWETLERHVRDVVERGRRARAHIVNLGHGVPPTTDPDVLKRVVDLVHAL